MKTRRIIGVIREKAEYNEDSRLELEAAIKKWSDKRMSIIRTLKQEEG